jgi:hypothetical protein
MKSEYHTEEILEDDQGIYVLFEGHRCRPVKRFSEFCIGDTVRMRKSGHKEEQDSQRWEVLHTNSDKLVENWRYFIKLGIAGVRDESSQRRRHNVFSVLLAPRRVPMLRASCAV